MPVERIPLHIQSPLGTSSSDVTGWTGRQFAIACTFALDGLLRIQRGLRQGQSVEADVSMLGDMLEALVGIKLLEPLSPSEAEDLESRAFEARDLVLRDLRMKLSPSEAFERLDRNFSLFLEKMDSLRTETLRTLDQLQEPARTFAEVARKAAELSEDIRSLEPSERVKIAEILRTEVESAFDGSSAPNSRAVEFPYPVVPSSELLSEKARRKPAKQQWLKRNRSVKQTPVDFIRSVYGDRLGLGFTQADLKACDQSLYFALHQWLQKSDPNTGQRNTVPPDVDLPNIEDWNARRLIQLRLFPSSIDVNERKRLSFVVASRIQRAGTPD